MATSETPRSVESSERPTKRVLKAAEDAATTVRDEVSRRVDAHPYGTLAVALGVGYLLAGGLFSPLTARIVGFGLRTGLRVAVVPLLEVELVRAAQEWAEHPAGGTNGHS